MIDEYWIASALVFAVAIIAMEYTRGESES